MADDGFFNGQRVEFIDGEIIDEPPQKNAHAYVISMAAAALIGHFSPRQFWVRVQATLIDPAEWLH